MLIAMALFTLYVFRVRTVLTDRVVYLVCGLAGIILVVDPDLSTWIAHLLGIGRGVDLIVYLFMIAALFYSVAVSSELKKTKRQITHVVRQMAIAHPIEGKSLEENDQPLHAGQETEDIERGSQAS